MNSSDPIPPTHLIASVPGSSALVHRIGFLRGEIAYTNHGNFNLTTRRLLSNPGVKVLFCGSERECRDRLNNALKLFS